MNCIPVIITKVSASGGVVLADMDVHGTSLSALLLDSPENSGWLRNGVQLFAVFKETEVSIAIDLSGKISLRNRIPCIVKKVNRGELLSVVEMQFIEFELTSAITSRSVDMLGLKPGMEVTAMIKANEITLMQK